MVLLAAGTRNECDADSLIELSQTFLGYLLPGFGGRSTRRAHQAATLAPDVIARDAE